MNARTQKSDKVPSAMQEKYAAIVALTDDFSARHLNQEYAQLIRYAVAALSRKRPSPLERGKANVWACAVTHAVGRVNFLYDKSQTPHVGVAELYAAFGIAPSTGQNKSKFVRNTLDMGQFSSTWTLPSRMEGNLMAWMVSVNGFIVDARSLPRELQWEAYQKGLIPYLPGDETSAT